MDGISGVGGAGGVTGPQGVGAEPPPPINPRDEAIINLDLHILPTFGHISASEHALNYINAKFNELYNLMIKEHPEFFTDEEKGKIEEMARTKDASKRETLSHKLSDLFGPQPATIDPKEIEARTKREAYFMLDHINEQLHEVSFEHFIEYYIFPSTNNPINKGIESLYNLMCKNKTTSSQFSSAQRNLIKELYSLSSRPGNFPEGALREKTEQLMKSLNHGIML